MSAQTNAVTEPRFGGEAVVASRTAVTRPVYWSVRRELWENWWLYGAPLGAAWLVIVGVLLGGFYMFHPGFQGKGTLQSLDPMQQQMFVDLQCNMTELLIMLSTFLVSIFYCLDALYGERRDRSILFWRSLPVSDTVTVLTKASVPIVILPLLTFVIAAVTQWIVVVIDAGTLGAHGRSVAVLGQVPVLKMQAGLLYHLLTVHALWYAPIYAWFLLVSAWARRMPFLWAFLPPLMIGIVEKIAFNTTYFARFIGNRVGGAPSGGDFGQRGGSMAHGMSMTTPGLFFMSPGLWGGLIVAAIFLAAAVWLRRYRAPING
jgi:ABC-2 type transport system permease protein